MELPYSCHVRNKFLWFISHLVYVTLLQQPEQTKTPNCCPNLLLYCLQKVYRLGCKEGNSGRKAGRFSEETESGFRETEGESYSSQNIVLH